MYQIELEDLLLLPSGTTPEHEINPNWALLPTGLTPEHERYHPCDLYIRSRVGRKRKLDMFPEIVDRAQEFITSAGFAADRNRRDAGRCGATMPEVQEHLYMTIPGLRDEKISITSTRRLFTAPHMGHVASRYYWDLVSAKIPQKRNSHREHDEDAHAYSSRAKQVREMAAYYDDEVAIYSCDNKNKINFGKLAVPRYLHIGRHYPHADTPNYNDHDFGLSGYRTTPMGYMRLEAQTPLCYMPDKDGRLKVVVPCTGHLFVNFRADQYHNNTMAEHFEDLSQIYHTKPKKVLVLVTDNGADWATRNFINLLYYYRLWKRLNLDCLMTVSYCPKHSALNPIEHAWSPCTKCLISITLPSSLPDESIPPCLQRIDDAIKRKKEMMVVNSGMMELVGHFNNVKFDNFVVSSNFKMCQDPQEAENARNHAALKYTLETNPRLVADADLMEEIRHMMDHLDRRLDMIIIKKCDKKCDWCTQNPISAHRTMSFLERNPGFPCAVSDPAYPGHYHTFLDYINGRVLGKEMSDGEMGRYNKLSAALDRCPRCETCKYTFTSARDKKRHYKYFHNR